MAKRRGPQIGQLSRCLVCFFKRLNAAWCPRQTRTMVHIGIYAICILQCIYIYTYYTYIYICNWIMFVLGYCFFMCVWFCH